MEPPLRVIPPTYGQLAADPDAPHVAFFAGETRDIGRLASTLGLPVKDTDTGIRVTGAWRGLELLARTLASEVHSAAPLLERYLRPAEEWRLRLRVLPLDRPVVMGIVNLTEDSFSGDGVGVDTTAALGHAAALRDAGATIIDVGGETARADRPVMNPVEEARAVGACVSALVREGHIVSVDTYKAEVATAALESGADIVNDISGLTQGSGAAEAAAAAGAGYVLNYSASPPKQRPLVPPRYTDVTSETIAWTFERVARLREIGVADEQIAIDPGIAFGKSHDEDIQVLRRIGELRTLGLPVLLAHSRKNFIGSVYSSPPTARDLETHVVTALAYAQGIHMFRVHDVEGTARAARMAAALVQEPAGAFAPDDASWPWRAGAAAAHMTLGDADKAAPDGQRW